MMIEEKIIGRLIEKERFACVLKRDLFELLKGKYEPEIEMKDVSLDDLHELMEKHLDSESLLDFAALRNVGLAKCDIEEVLNIGKATLEKLIKEKRIKAVGELSFTKGRCRINYYIYSIADVINVFYEGNYKQKRKVNVTCQELPPTDENIAQALYIINKSAKVSRDTKNDAYIDRSFKTCNASKTRMLNHYRLKDATMKKLIAENRMVFIGINKQIISDEREQYLELYKLGGFSFHLPCNRSIKEINETKLLNDITEVIGSERKIDTSMKYRDAINLLERYSGETLKMDRDYYW